MIVVVTETVLESVILSIDESNEELLVGKVFKVTVLVNWLLGTLLGFLLVIVLWGLDGTISLIKTDKNLIVQSTINIDLNAIISIKYHLYSYPFFNHVKLNFRFFLEFSIDTGSLIYIRSNVCLLIIFAQLTFWIYLHL